MPKNECISLQFDHRTPLEQCVCVKNVNTLSGV